MVLEVELMAVNHQKTKWVWLALAGVLLARAGADAGFGQALAAWWDQASQVRVGGDVANTVSGGTQYGPVLQGRDFTGLTFATPPVPPVSPAPDPGT